MATAQLSTKSIAILRLIADGWSYAQIVDGYTGATYKDIFAAAQEALALVDGSTGPQPTPESAIDRIRRRHPKAYEPWSDEDEAHLIAMHAEGQRLSDMSDVPQRQPSALRSRLRRLKIDDSQVPD